MPQIPLENPSPDFKALEEILKGEKEPEKVRFIELGIDSEVIKFVTERFLGRKYITETEEALWKCCINFYYRMGYDCFTFGLPGPSAIAKTLKTDDTAILSDVRGGKRTWMKEAEGLITSWEDFETFPWESIGVNFESRLKFFNENLPEGMKVVVISTLFENVRTLLGWGNLFRMVYLQPDLVKAVFDKWGETVYRQYEKAISYECVGAIFHGDDLGYKKGLMMSPNMLRDLVFPWFKKYASLAHQHGKMFWYHSCGNIYQVMEDLIEDVKIDAFHSYQDAIMPVWEFKKKYGDRIAALGGVDVDKLSRYSEKQLQRYVKKILDECMPGGRYALGSGNTVTNYVPVKNYLVMLEEGLRYKTAKRE